MNHLESESCANKQIMEKYHIKNVSKKFRCKNESSGKNHVEINESSLSITFDMNCVSNSLKNWYVKMNHVERIVWK